MACLFDMDEALILQSRGAEKVPSSSQVILLRRKQF